MKYAIEVGHLDDDPFKRITWTPPKASKRLDRRRVPNPAQVTELLTAVSYVGSWDRGRGRRLVAFFACMYYAMMRPEEVIALRVSDCHLPDKGWGLLTLEKATPTAGKAWTDSGKLHDEKGLKQRAEDEIRPVPIPPVLVAMLKEHIREFSGKNSDGRVFGNERGGRIVASTYSRVWREARPFAMTPDRVDSLMAAVPYDLRHAGVSLGLRSTRDPAMIAERAGHSVEIMMSTYSWVLDDQGQDREQGDRRRARRRSARLKAVAVPRHRPPASVGGSSFAWNDLRKQSDFQATNRPRTPTQGRFQRHTLAHVLDSGNQKAAAQMRCGLFRLGAPGRIRTYAPASGGRCSIP